MYTKFFSFQFAAVIIIMLKETKSQMFKNNTKKYI